VSGLYIINLFAVDLEASKCHEKNCIVLTSGGFEGENKDKAFGSSPEKGIFVISHLSTNSMSVWVIKNYMDL
jgi:hypothetical protein